MHTIRKQFVHDRRFRTTFFTAAAVLMLLAVAWTTADAQDGLVVKVYPCPAGRAAATAEKLRAEFGTSSNVRIAADERTSQIVVQAPPDIQGRVGQRLTVLATSASIDTRQSSNLRPRADAMQTRGTTLRNADPGQVVNALRRTLGNRLSALPSQNPKSTRYNLTLANGGDVELVIDSATRQVTARGADAAIDACLRLVQAFDTRGEAGPGNVRLVPLRTNQLASIHRAADAIGSTTSMGQSDRPNVTMFQQTQETPETAPPGRPHSEPAAGAAAPAPNEIPADDKGRTGLLNPVQVEVLEGIDGIMLRGNAQDLDRVEEIIKQIERLSAETEPAIEILTIKYIDCVAMSNLVGPLYEQAFSTRLGNVSITPIVKPNAILLVGRPENVKTVVDLIDRLDQPSVPDAQFQVFHLRFSAAATAQQVILDMFPALGGLASAVRVTADVRSNAVIVQASPQDMTEVAALISRLDTSTSASVNEVRIIQLQHSMAQDVANVLTTAIGAASNQTPSGRPAAPTQPGQPQQPQQPQRPQQPSQPGQPSQQPGQPGQPGQPQTGAPPSSSSPAQIQQRSAMLRFMAVDAKGQRLLNSGILSDVQITADQRGNALVVSAPAESLDLIEALVRQLDNLAADAKIKVYTIINGDATTLSIMLGQLFGTQTTTTTQQPTFPFFPQPQQPQQPQGGNTGVSVVPLRFAVDARTNSIIACGSTSDLDVVEVILARLDEQMKNRRNEVFELKNSKVADVSAAINQYLTNQRQIEQQSNTSGMTSAFEQLEREVVVVPEPIGNRLILSATPRFFDEIKAMIEKLDARPKMVLIQVLIAQVALNNTNEFGIELGLQDSVLFDRSILSDLQTTNTTLPNGTTTSSVVSGTVIPGFNFNNGNPLGSSATAGSTANQVGGQALSNFSVGRANTAGIGGLVLSLSSESVSALIRALALDSRIEVLSKPQIMTRDNQPAFVQIGQQVPFITGSAVTSFGLNNTTQFKDVGLILRVQPRISPEGLVVMVVDAVKSQLNTTAPGIPIAIVNGQTITQPIIDTTEAYTTIAAMNGQTIILAGLMGREKDEIHRKVPLLGDVPLLGQLFRYDSVTNTKTELLIIMTPHIIDNDADADAIKRAEAARMSWCLCDVTTIYGEAGLRKRTDNWSDAEVKTFYPDAKYQPGTSASPDNVPEPILAPQGAPAGQPMPVPRPAAPPVSEPSRGPALISPMPEGTQPMLPNGEPPLPDDPSARLQQRRFQQTIQSQQAQYPQVQHLPAQYPQGAYQPPQYPPVPGGQVQASWPAQAQQTPSTQATAQPMQQAQYQNYPPTATTGGAQSVVYRQPLPGQQAIYPQTPPGQPAVYQQPLPGQPATYRPNGPGQPAPTYPNAAQPVVYQQTTQSSQ